jgi:cytochrome b
MPAMPAPSSMTSEASGPAPQRVRVWDLPTRLFHWLLAGSVLCSIVSVKLGAMAWHFRFGYLVLALLLFRLVWGLVGGHWSRFVNFVFSPLTLWRYLRGQARPDEHLEVGHSPVGALSVFALLGILLIQLATGLVADDEIANVGPLNKFVSLDIAAQATGWHNSWGQWLLFSLVGLHIAAIAFYLGFANRNLIGPMLGGDKEGLPPGTPSAVDNARSRWLAAALALAALVVAVLVSRASG